MREEEAEFSAEEEQALLAVLNPLSHVRVSPGFLSRVLEKSGLPPIQPGELEAIRHETITSEFKEQAEGRQASSDSETVLSLAASRKRRKILIWIALPTAAMVLLTALWVFRRLPQIPREQADNWIYVAPVAVAFALDILSDFQRWVQISEGNAQEKFLEGLKYEKKHFFNLAIASYKDAANQGDIKSQVKLSLMYDMGIGTPKDPKEAKLWADKAIQQNEKQAREYKDIYAQGFIALENSMACFWGNMSSGTCVK